jgi:hypothetical protein
LDNYNDYNSRPPAAPPPGEDERPLSVKDWVINILLTCIPCVGIILLLVWAFSSAGNINRKNWARAMLIISIIMIAISIIFSTMLGGFIAMLMPFIEQSSYY